MTNPNYTHLTVLIDKSGSMSSKVVETINGFNSFLTEQKQVTGSNSYCTLSKILFSNSYDLLTDFLPIEKCSLLDTNTYIPSGLTSLQDAIAKGIIDTGRKLANLPEEDRPSKVLFVIITDGEENSSQEYGGTDGYLSISQMISVQQNTYNWEFVFLGTSRESIAYAKGLGIANVKQYVDSPTGVINSWKMLSHTTSLYRVEENYIKGSFFSEDSVDAEVI